MYIEDDEDNGDDSDCFSNVRLPSRRPAKAKRQQHVNAIEQLRIATGIGDEIATDNDGSGARLKRPRKTAAVEVDCPATAAAFAPTETKFTAICEFEYDVNGSGLSSELATYRTHIFRLANEPEHKISKNKFPFVRYLLLDRDDVPIILTVFGKDAGATYNVQPGNVYKWTSLKVEVSASYAPPVSFGHPFSLIAGYSSLSLPITVNESPCMRALANRTCPSVTFTQLFRQFDSDRIDACDQACEPLPDWADDSEDDDCDAVRKKKKRAAAPSRLQPMVALDCFCHQIVSYEAAAENGNAGQSPRTVVVFAATDLDEVACYCRVSVSGDSASNECRSTVVAGKPLRLIYPRFARYKNKWECVVFGMSFSDGGSVVPYRALVDGGGFNARARDLYHDKPYSVYTTLMDSLNEAKPTFSLAATCTTTAPTITSLADVCVWHRDRSLSALSPVAPTAFVLSNARIARVITQIQDVKKLFCKECWKDCSTAYKKTCLQTLVEVNGKTSDDNGNADNAGSGDYDVDDDDYGATAYSCYLHPNIKPVPAIAALTADLELQEKDVSADNTDTGGVAQQNDKVHKGISLRARLTHTALCQLLDVSESVGDYLSATTGTAVGETFPSVETIGELLSGLVGTTPRLTCEALPHCPVAIVNLEREVASSPLPASPPIASLSPPVLKTHSRRTRR